MENKKKILIIGGLVFIGHNLAIYLKKFGYKLKIIDSLLIHNILALKKNPLEYPNPKIAKKFLLDRLKLVKKNNIIFDKLDARNYKRLTKSINKFSPDVVIHLAVFLMLINQIKIHIQHLIIV